MIYLCQHQFSVGELLPRFATQGRGQIVQVDGKTLLPQHQALATCAFREQEFIAASAQDAGNYKDIQVKEEVAMSRRDHRPKASEVFRNSNLVFAQKVSFEDAFPQIEDITIVGEESSLGSPQGNPFSYRKPHLPGEYIDCSNPVCYRGGFSVGSVLREMVRNKETEREARGICQGNEASPKGKKIYRKCLNTFKMKISIKYKEVVDAVEE